MVGLNKIEINKCNLIFEFYNKVSTNPLSIEEKDSFIDNVCNLSKEINEDLSKILNVCYEFAFRFHKISDICNLTKSSILLSRIAEL
jgi:hypothetical protein